MPSFFRTYRLTREGARVDGVFTLAFIHNSDYYLTPIQIYQDGLIDCWDLVSFPEFQEKVRSGWVVTQPPPDARISVAFLGRFTATNELFWVEPEEFIKEVADEIEELNGRPTTSDRCLEAWGTYKASPGEATKERLRIAYEAIPEHNRMYVLKDFDAKDNPIRLVLGI
jgi:hypothetical protein